MERAQAIMVEAVAEIQNPSMRLLRTPKLSFSLINLHQHQHQHASTLYSEYTYKPECPKSTAINTHQEMVRPQPVIAAPKKPNHQLYKYTDIYDTFLKHYIISHCSP